MKFSAVEKLIQNIRQDYQIFAPVKDDKEFFVSKISDLKQIDYSGRLPLNSWKHLFLPPGEELLEFSKKFRRPDSVYPRRCAWNMSFPDLKALGLLDVVFADDPYYQDRRRNILVCGLAVGEPDVENYAEHVKFSRRLAEDSLEHVTFDIFLEKTKKGTFDFFAGSVLGREVLSRNKIKNFTNVQFAGYIPEQGPDADMLSKQSLIKKSMKHRLWDELAEICLACGKCSLVCPTCFCFDTEDQAQEKTVSRQRVWGSCFYPEFTRLAGGTDYTATVKQKLQFWYEHKFVRIPAEYAMPGCVSCGRCAKVCPVGIDIAKNFVRLSEGSRGLPATITSRAGNS